LLFLYREKLRRSLSWIYHWSTRMCLKYSQFHEHIC
jgi:hypothetical protein